MLKSDLQKSMNEQGVAPADIAGLLAHVPETGTDAELAVGLFKGITDRGGYDLPVGIRDWMEHNLPTEPADEVAAEEPLAMPVLLRSAKQPALIRLNDAVGIDFVTIAAAAYAASGLSVDLWNAQPDDVREGKFEAMIEEVKAKVEAGEPVDGVLPMQATDPDSTLGSLDNPSTPPSPAPVNDPLEPPTPADPTEPGSNSAPADSGATD